MTKGKMEMKKLYAFWLVLLSMFSVPALAVAPAWVATSFTAGQTQLTEIIAEIAPMALVVVALLVGFGLVIKMFRRSAK